MEQRITQWLIPGASASVTSDQCNRCGFDVEGGHHPSCKNHKAGVTRRVLRVPGCKTNMDWINKKMAEMKAEGKNPILINSSDSPRLEGKLVEPGMLAIAIGG